MASKTDIEIARETKLKTIDKIINKFEIDESYVNMYGKYKAKIDLKLLKDLECKKDGKLILVTSINPTPLGEGKTTSAIGLADAMNKIGKNTILALREPSMGPVFGIKGGATGGGHSQIAPMEEINLHFTGDIHAITSANNLLAALIDNHIYFGNELKFKKVVWRRALDLNDRALRKVQIGLSGEKNLVPREDAFDITVASEIMAVLCLANDLDDLKRRLGNMIIGYNDKDEPILCSDLKAEDCLVVILKDAMNPNIVQTLEHNPALIHGGPFANIAHGSNSIIATKLGLKLADYVVTEAGFGADLGAEKFFNIKCRNMKKSPDCAVIVATLRALKYHGGASKEECQNENLEALDKGIDNLIRHIKNINSFKLNSVVAINKFETDSEKEIELLEKRLENIAEVSLIDNWTYGGKGAIDLAEKVIKICDKKHSFENTYDLEDPLEVKIEKVAKKIYGAKGIVLTEEAKEDVKRIKEMNWDKHPVCIAKTQYSFSDDPKNLLCEGDYEIHINKLEYKGGAEFIVVKTGKIMTMPGLPKVPAAEKIRLDENHDIEGIF